MFLPVNAGAVWNDLCFAISPISSSSCLIAQYNFSGNANDNTGNSLNGIVNGAILAPDRFGTLNSAYHFDGVNDYIEVTDNPLLGFSNNQMSVSYWAKIESYSTNSSYNKLVISKQSGSGTTQTGFNIWYTSGDAGLRIKDGVSGNFGGASIGSPSNLNQWYHVVYTWDGTTGISYVDGVLINSSVSSNAAIGANNLSLLIGKANWSNINSEPFHGWIDDINIYNCAITQQEVDSLFNAGSVDCNADIATGLVAQYDFTGNANDLSGNGNNGNVNGATLIADRFGNVNSAYSFNGLNNYIEIPNSSTLQFTSNLQTISFWMKIPQIPSPVIEQALFEKMDQHLGTDLTGNSAQGFKIVFSPTSDIDYNIKSGSGSSWGSVKIPNNTLSVNQYYHIAFTNDNDSLRSYLNGVKINATKIPIGTVIGANISPFLIGKELWTSNGSNMDYFNGILDDIAIFDRALTPCDIDSLYNMPNPTTVGITQLNNNEIFSVYPNPTITILNIANGQGNYIITDVFGRIVKEVSITSDNYQVNTTNLKSGVYFLISKEDNSSVKFIKQ